MREEISREEIAALLARGSEEMTREEAITEQETVFYPQVDGITPTVVRQTGNWIFEKGDGRTCVDGHICSVCKTSYHTKVPYFAEYKYCPNCGAKMVEPQESEG